VNQIVTPKELALDAAQADRARTFRPRNSEPRVLMSYTNGALITRGYYSDAAGAKSVCPDVGRWIELGEGSDMWRSECGRVLVVSDYRDVP
jgi:hypothetical protein